MAWSMLGAGVEVTVRRGQLMVRTLSPIPALYRGFQLHPDDEEDPYVFRLDLSRYGLGTVRVVFSRDRSGATTRLHLDGILLSAEKYPRSLNPRLWATGAVGVLAAASAVRALRPASGMRRGRHEPHDVHRAVADERYGAGRSDQNQAGVQSRSGRGPPSADRGSQPVDQRRCHRPGRAGAETRQRRLTVRSPPALTCRRFHGVPFTVKENIDVAGTPTTQGFKALADAYPRRDAPVVERMKAAGAIPIGRTNLPSGAIRWHCESELWGATVNPWDRSRTPGASSAGEAAAIATGMSSAGARQ